MTQTAGQVRNRAARLSNRTLYMFLVLGSPLLVATHLSCATPGSLPTYGFVEPPRAELQASLAQDPIKTSDVLQLKLPDGSQATLTETFLVAPDGTIEVRNSGKIQVAGKTLKQAQEAVQAAVAVSNAAEQAVELAMSEYYLVQVDRHGVKRLTRVPIKGELRVSDALAHLKPSDKLIWVVRPDPSRYLAEQTVPIDWETVAHDRNNRANLKLQPGDWLFVAEEPANGAARVFSALAGMGQPDTSHVR